MIYKSEGGAKNLVDPKLGGSSINLLAVEAIEPPLVVGNYIVVNVQLNGVNRPIFNVSTQGLKEEDVDGVEGVVSIRKRAVKRYQDVLAAWTKAIEKKS